MLNRLTTRTGNRPRAAVGLVAAAMTLAGLSSSLAQTASTRIRHRLAVAPFDPANPRGPYLGQRPPGIVPEVFAPGFISSGADEYAIAFSPDGNEIYFSRFTRTDNSNTIWVTRQTIGTWTIPIKAEFTGRYYNSEAFITRDNTRMYFVSIREGINNFQLYAMYRTGTGWSTPIRLGGSFSYRSKMYPTVATNGNLYFSEFANNVGSFYMARNNQGSFETPQPLSPTVNAFPMMGHAFVAPDESWLVFDAAPNVPQSYDSVLHVSFKQPGGDWLPPVRLNLANMTTNEICPAVSPDGKYLFFTRRNGEHDDIWWVDARVVFDLRPAAQGAGQTNVAKAR